jgi:xylan 1,4-beta-xylosidase
MAHLCSRPLSGCSILGRETAFQNVEWTDDGWFRVVSTKGKLPMTEFKVNGLPETCFTESLTRENFDTAELPCEFLTLRQSPEHCGISLNERPGCLRIYGGNSLSSKYRQGLAARRQQDFSCDCETCVEFEPAAYQQMAGLVCYYNYDNYYYLKIGFDEDLGKCISVTSVVNREVTETEPVPVPQGTEKIFLKAEIRGEALQFYGSKDAEEYCTVGGKYDMKNLSDERVNGNGFTGAMVGIYQSAVKKVLRNLATPSL